MIQVVPGEALGAPSHGEHPVSTQEAADVSIDKDTRFLDEYTHERTRTHTGMHIAPHQLTQMQGLPP